MSAAADKSVAAITRRIRPVLESDERVCFAYLFGSVAEGTARPGSDVDIAVLTWPRGTLLDDARLQDELAAALGRDDVDLLVLDDVPLWLRYRVIRCTRASRGTVVITYETLSSSLLLSGSPLMSSGRRIRRR